VTEILSRVWNPADRWPEHARVETIGIGDQHSSRAWEYALALHAIERWRSLTQPSLTMIYDVGGAGSSFRTMIPALVIDPAAAKTEGVPKRLQDYTTVGATLANVITCLSVLEHIPVNELEDFCYCLACLLAPGGLLVLTVDFQPDPTIEGDPMHWHWMRAQIFNPRKLRRLLRVFEWLNLGPYGRQDWTWHGALEQTDNSNWGYAPASLVLTKLCTGGKVTIL
jgi:hypothetical protein